MRPVTIVINAVVLPLLLIIFAAWFAIAAGVVRKVALRTRHFLEPTVGGRQVDFRCFFQHIAAAMRTFSIVRFFGTFYHRPIEGMLVWIGMVVAGMVLMAVWSGVVIALFGHYP